MKNKLTLAILVVLSSNSNAYTLYSNDNSKVDFYGQIRTYFSIYDGKDTALEADSSRVGIKGHHNLFDDTDMFAKFEFNLAGNSGTLSNRQHILGFKNNQFGSLSFGRMWTTADDMPDADYSYAFGGKTKLYKTLDYASHDSLIKYQYGNIWTTKDNDWFVSANYGLPEEESGVDSGRKQELKELYAGYVIGKVKIHGGYGIGRDKNRNYGTSTGNDVQSSYYNFSPTFLIKDGRIGFTYSHRDLEKLNGDKVEINTDTYSLAFQKKITNVGNLNGWFVPYAGYEYEQSNASIDAIDDTSFTNIYAGLQYYWNKSTFVYLEYGYTDGDTINLNTDGDALLTAVTSSYDSENNVEIGFRFYF